MENIVKRGNLEVLLPSTDKGECWENRYFVLCGDNLPRLDWYNSEVEFRQKQPNRKTVYLLDIVNITTGLKNILGRKHTFEITKKVENKQEQTTYSAETETEVQDWVNHIRSLQRDMAIDKDRRPAVKLPYATMQNSKPNSQPFHNGAATLSPTLLVTPSLDLDQNSRRYEVRVEASEVHEKCGLSADKTYLLYLSALDMALVEGDGRKVLLKWPYKFIRRYGRSTHTFTFEAGRKCDSGEGLFVFSVDDGEKVFEEVHKKTKAMKNHKSGSLDPSSTISSSTAIRTSPKTPSSPTSPLETPPVIPERKYGDTMNHHEVKQEIVNKNQEEDNPATPPISSENHKKHHHFHGVKTKIKENIKHFGDKVSDTLHINDKKSKGSIEDLPKGGSGSLTVDDHSDILGTVGKYNSSPNMKQRCLPEIPVNTNAKCAGNQKQNPFEKTPSVESDHIYEDAETINLKSDAFPHTLPNEYALYDKECSSTKPSFVNGGGSELYEDHGQCDSGLSDAPVEYLKSGRISRSFSAKSAESGIVDDQETYSSIDEEDRQKIIQQIQKLPSEPGTLKMSEILSQAKPKSNDSFDDVDGGMDDYDYTYTGDYDSIDFLKSENRTLGKKAVDDSLADDGTYGMLSLGLKNKTSAKDEVSYMNTSKMGNPRSKKS